MNARFFLVPVTFQTSIGLGYRQAVFCRRICGYERYWSQINLISYKAWYFISISGVNHYYWDVFIFIRSRVHDYPVPWVHGGKIIMHLIVNFDGRFSIFPHINDMVHPICPFIQVHGINWTWLHGSFKHAKSPYLLHGENKWTTTSNSSCQIMYVFLAIVSICNFSCSSEKETWQNQEKIVLIVRLSAITIAWVTQIRDKKY